MRTLAIGAAIVLCLAVSACAGGKNGMLRESSMDDSIDAGKVLAVNQWAVNRHATVVWVNYPTKPVHPKDTSG